MSDDPVAWRVIERGWSVLDAAGNEIGKVDQITGDVEADIFDGITVGDGGTVLTRPKYVPSEHVASITQGEIVLDLAPGDVAKLEPYRELVSEPLASLQREPGQATGGLLQRLFGRRR
jgi:uncharacterized protein YrrD